MFGEEKNLKDTVSSPSPLQGEGRGEVSLSQGLVLSYTKTDKLITALYMVTDIIDKDEPLRNKLRTLGAGIISDMHLVQQNNAEQAMSFIQDKISELMSFLDIASAVSIISEMNCNILRKEFSKLSYSIKEASDKAETLNNRRVNLSEIFTEEDPATSSPEDSSTTRYQTLSVRPAFSARPGIGHPNPTRIGVQNGGTLLKALSGVAVSDRKINHSSAEVFEALKRQRQEGIKGIIKTINGGLPAKTGATIKDIKDMIKTIPGKTNPLISCGEKTLQRELVSMVKGGVLNKTGEKRWSKYFLK
jgi:hypothetical protein